MVDAINVLSSLYSFDEDSEPIYFYRNTVIFPLCLLQQEG